MRAALGGDLREVRDGEDLHVAAHLADERAHFVRRAAADSGVDFVEDHSGHAGVAGHHGLEAEHNAADFASGRAFRKVHGRGGAAGAEAEDDAVRACGAGLAFREFYREAGLFQFEPMNGTFDVLRKRRGCLGSTGAEFPAHVGVGFFRFFELFLQFRHLFFQRSAVVQFFAQFLADFDQFGDRADIVLAHQLIQHRDAVFDLGQTLLGEVHSRTDSVYLGADVVQFDAR